MTRTALLGVVAVVVATAGCATFKPRPIVPAELLRDLQAVRLEALRPAEAASAALPGPAFDPTDGLSSDEAVAVAMFLNPDLRAFRRERGVAEGELVAAGLLPNPTLLVTWLHIDNFTRSLATSGFDVSLSWAPPRPGERDARLARARARVGEVQALVASEEWRLASEVRKAYATLWAVEERLRLVEASLRLQERVRRFYRERLEQGDASRLDLNFVEIQYAARLREREVLASEAAQGRLEVNRLLGLPPRYEVTLQATPDPLAYRAPALEPVALESLMIDQRPQLVVARHEYEQAEQSLRLAHIQRLPWPRFGPAYERDGAPGEGSIDKIGFGIGLELPIANLNQGEIARLEAVRDKLREAFAARIHAGRAEINDALRTLRAQERLIRLFEETTRPALDENAALVEAGFEMGEFNLVQLVTTQDKILESRREFVHARLGYQLAVYDLERALGARVDTVGSGQGATP